MMAHPKASTHCQDRKRQVVQLSDNRCHNITYLLNQSSESAATNFCAVAQWVFNLVQVKCVLHFSKKGLMHVGNVLLQTFEHCIRNAQYLKQLLVTMPQKEHRHLSKFFDPYGKKIWLKAVRGQITSPQVTQT
jgi:hypothetical protein